MVCLLVLFPWDLNKLGLKVAYLLPYLLQVFLHSFNFAFVVTIHLTCDHLRITINNHTCGSCCFGEI